MRIRRMSRSTAVWMLLTVSLAIAAPVHAAPFDHFEFDSTGQSWANAYLLGNVAHYAYRSKLKDAGGDSYLDKARSVYAPYGLEVVELISKGSATADTQAAVLRNDRVLIVAFSGSESMGTMTTLKDWVLTDARMTMREVDGVNVHSGFYDALAIAYPDIKASVVKHADGRDVWVTGHSLGGALAVLAALLLDIDNIPIRGVYTYAAPRVGDAALAQRLEQRLGSRFQRWIVDRDPVPRVPPHLDKYPYESAGVTNVIRGDGSHDLDAQEDPGSVPNPATHSMAVYVNYLYRALSDADRRRLPSPPSMCGTGQSHVGDHPDDGRPLCKRLGARKVSQNKCEDKGGAMVDDWCAFADEDKYRYRVRPLKD